MASSSFDFPSSAPEQRSTQLHRRECLFKIIVIGDMSTGKTSLIQRYVRDAFPQNYKPTLGVDFATKLIQFDDTLVRLQFWDISGQDRFAVITRVYYRDSHGAIVVYDCKRQETLTGAYRWKKDLDSKLALDNGQPIPSVLVANKCDLDNNITEQELADHAKQGGFRSAFKVSAKTGAGVDSMLDFLIKNIVSAERDGLYMMPIFHRDPQARHLTYEEGEGKEKSKSILKNVCC